MNVVSELLFDDRMLVCIGLTGSCQISYVLELYIYYLIYLEMFDCVILMKWKVYSCMRHCFPIQRDP